MGREDVAAGKAKQLKGKARDIAGAARGDTGQQVKGKIQKGVGKAQVDIMTGKKTVLSYLLKPVLKARSYAFTER